MRPDLGSVTYQVYSGSTSSGQTKLENFDLCFSQTRAQILVHCTEMQHLTYRRPCAQQGSSNGTRDLML